MTEAEWMACDWPYDMLKHLDGKLEDQAFMRFSVLCCRRIWPLLSDPRSRAVVEVTEAYLAGQLSAEDAARVVEEWDRAYPADEVKDLAGGSTNEAIESVYGLGLGHAAQVAKACFESVGYAASAQLSESGASQPEITASWDAAESAERQAQCDLLRDIFGNPFCSVGLDPALLTTAVTSLARAAYEERALPSGELDPARLTILADALEEAGCTDQTILDHLRGSGPHFRGCWPLDLVLAKK